MGRGVLYLAGDLLDGRLAEMGELQERRDALGGSSGHLPCAEGDGLQSTQIISITNATAGGAPSGLKMAKKGISMPDWDLWAIGQAHACLGHHRRG